MVDEEVERQGTREDAASLLHAAANAVSAGILELTIGDEPVEVTVPESVNIEVELEDEGGERELEIELKWAEEDVSTGDNRRPDEAKFPWRGQGSSGSEQPEISLANPPRSLAQFQLFRDRRDEWRWRLVHRNGNVIATSGEGYTRRAGAEKGLKSVVRNAPGAELVEIDNR